MAAIALSRTPVSQNKKAYPIKDETCRIECPECGEALLKVDHTDSTRTWWRCALQCTGKLIGMDWPHYAGKPYVPTITDIENLQ